VALLRLKEKNIMANLGFGSQNQYDPNNPSHQQGFRDLQGSLKGMVSNGNELGAKDLYRQKQGQYGFTDADYSPYATNGAGDGNFTAQQISEWKAPQAQVAAPAAGPSLDAYAKNPYLDQMAGNITSQMNENWTRNQLPSIRSGAMAAGGFGGSRQGVVEANGLNDMNRSLGQNLTNLYGQDYTNSQNRNLQKYGMDQSYDLGLRGNDLGFAGLDANINQNNFNNGMASANFGMGVYNSMQGGNQAGINSGNNIQNAPLDYQKYFTNSANGMGQGFGTSTSSSNMPSSPLVGAMGGMQLANAWNKNQPPPVYDDGYSLGLGSSYGGNRQGK
jgi:hypothetical protein